MRKLQKAADAHKVEKERSVNMHSSVKIVADQAEVKIRQQNEELQELHVKSEQMSTKLKSIEAENKKLKGRCIIS